MQDKPYPSWICNPCGEKYGKGTQGSRESTFHEGTCGVCGERAIVTEPRDWGHLRDGWQEVEK